MRKDSLVKLLQKFESQKPLFRKTSSRITILKKYLKTYEVRLLSDNDDISFDCFLKYFKIQNPKSKKMFDQTYLQRNTLASNLFKTFIGRNNVESKLDPVSVNDSKKIEKKIGGSSLMSHFNSSITSHIANYSTATDFISLAMTCTFFNKELRGVSYWKQKLIRAGCKKENLIKVISFNVVRDYKKLYCAFLVARKYPASSEHTSIWELLCLSGDPKAIEFAFKNNFCTPQTRNLEGRNALDLVALNGDVSSARYLLKECKMRVRENDFELLMCVAIGGHLEFLKFLIKKYGLDPKKILHPFYRMTILHVAASNGNLLFVRYLIEHCKLDPNDYSIHRHWRGAAFDCALDSGNLDLIRYLVNLCKIQLNMSFISRAVETQSLKFVIYYLSELGLPPGIKYEEHTLLHMAARCGNLPLIRYLILECKVDPTVLDGERQQNALHFATTYMHHDVLRFLLDTCKIDPNVKNKEGLTALDLVNFSYVEYEDVITMRCFLAAGFDLRNLKPNYSNFPSISGAEMYAAKMKVIEYARLEPDEAYKLYLINCKKTFSNDNEPSAQSNNSDQSSEDTKKMTMTM